jgi:hypothetical protein
MKASATESLGYCELKQHKKKLQWLQNPSQANGDNVNNVRRETSRTCRNKKREYLKEKIVSLKQSVRTKIPETYIDA